MATVNHVGLEPTAGVATVATVEPRESAVERPPVVSEDWLAVIIAAALIGLILAGVRPENPIQLGALILVPLTAGAALLRARVTRFVPGLVVLCLLAWGAQAIANHPAVASWSLEYVIFALAIGLAINHTITLPGWLREALRTEFYIKTGLVVLGGTILFDEIARAGLLGTITRGRDRGAPRRVRRCAVRSVAGDRSRTRETGTRSKRARTPCHEGK
jgi:hypothetical protein